MDACESALSLRLQREFGLAEKAGYTKAVDLIVEKRVEFVSDGDWDKYTIDFALRRLERKRLAIPEFTRIVPSFPAIEPGYASVQKIQRTQMKSGNG